MSKFFIALPLLFLIINSNAQSLDHQILVSTANVQETVSSFKNKYSSDDVSLSFDELDRAARIGNFRLADTTIKLKLEPVKIKKLPGILWGVGSMGIYLGTHRIAYGSLDNASYTSMAIYGIVGVLMGTIINIAREEAAMRKQARKKAGYN